MLRSMLIMIVFATPAMAHEGQHFHPHGIEPVWVAMLAVGALVAGVLLGRMRK
ncbi:MAG: hypothetical protein RLZZ437_898 [Pseudomonadota bacterium]|jgi:hypothetical protein